MFLKKKHTLIYLISGILVIIVIGAVAYFIWPKKKDKLDNPEPIPSNNKKEGRFGFYGDSLEKSGYVKFEEKEGNFYLFYISKIHPRIKQLSSEGKLLVNRKFIIRYGKIDSISEKGSIFTFNEFNKELEIVEA